MVKPGTRRIRLLSIVFILVTILLIVRLFSLQIINGALYNKKANKQYVTSVGDLFDRGSILFKKKDGTIVSGATVTSGFKLVINPTLLLTDTETLYQQLNTITPIDHDNFITRAGKVTDSYEEIKHHLTKEEADTITALKIKGISIEGENWRFYPGGRLASPVIGFMSYSGDVFTGRYGLERSYNDVLSIKGDKVSINFFAEIFSSISKTLFSNKEKQGDIVTTIEPTVQAKLEQELRSVMTTESPDSVGGIVIDPKTGAIIAMAHMPDFDSNNLKDEKNVNVFSNPMIENVFEMGSIVKPLTMAAGLDAGVVTADTKYDDKGFVVFNGSKIWNFDKKGRGVIPMQEVLNQSLNTGAAFVMQKLGRDQFRNYMLSYGIGQKTGIDLPNEAQDLVNNLQSTRDVEYATASFGQGIALTPIATVSALSVLANGGYLIHPHMVSEIDYKDGTTDKITFPLGKQVLKESTHQEITRMLVKAVDTALAGGKLKLEHYSLGAKTGTAQIAKDGGGGYYDDRYLNSFFGYFPAYDARFLVFMYVVHPRVNQFAGQTLANPFLETVKFLISYYQIPPDR